MRRACDTERRQQQELRSSEEAPLPVYRKPPNLVPKDKLLPSARFSCRCTSLYKLWLLIRGEVKQVATQPSQREGERYYVKHISASLSLYTYLMIMLCRFRELAFVSGREERAVQVVIITEEDQ